MGEVGKALEAAWKEVFMGRHDELTSKELARAAILAFLRAMPDSSDDEPDPFWHVSSLIAAIEKETAP